jgi:hypothetical protein
MRRAPLLGAVVLAVVLTGLLTATVATAGTYPPPVDTTQGTAVPSRVDVGGSTTFAGGGFQPGAPLEITIVGSRSVRPLRADEAGGFHTKVYFNGSARPGPHVLSATGVGAHQEQRVDTATVEVLGEQISSNATGRRHGFTGLDAVGLVGIVLVLLAVGSLVLLESERRYRRRMRRPRPAR